MSGQPHVSPEGTILLTTELSVLASDAITGGLKANPDAKHTSTKDPDDTLNNQTKWAPWGDNDDFPIKLMEQIGKIGVLGAALDINASMHYGNGIIWGRDEYTDQGKKVFKPERVKRWEELKRSIEIEITQADLVDSIETHYIAFAECILNNGKKFVNSVKALDPVFSRFELKKKDGRCHNLLYSSEFGLGTANPDYKTIPLFNPYNPTEHKKFVLPLVYRTWGRHYYPEPIYYACLRNGWGDVAVSVPKMIKSIYANQMSIKYIIRVSLAAMRRKYLMWDSPPECDQVPEKIMNWQLTKMRELQEEINNHLTKEENAFKGLFTFNDPATEDNGITIEPIKSYLDSTAELPNAAAANSEFLFTTQVDPAIIGMGIPGGKNLSGSGSDKREAREIKQAMLKRERMVTLRLPNLIARLENWDEALYPTYLDTDTSQTLDQNPTGKQTVVQP